MRIWIGTTKVEIRNDSFQVDRILSTKKTGIARMQYRLKSNGYYRTTVTLTAAGPF